MLGILSFAVDDECLVWSIDAIDGQYHNCVRNHASRRHRFFSKLEKRTLLSAMYMRQ